MDHSDDIENEDGNDLFEIDDGLYSDHTESMLCNLDIWCLGCCIAEIFYGVPLFSSTNVTDQFLKMFQILGNPNWRGIPWKYWKIDDEFKNSIEHNVDLFEINNKTENQQHRLTFRDIQSWKGSNAETVGL